MELREEEDFEKGLKLIAKSSMIVFIGLVLSKIFNYLYRIIVARTFGPEVYGLFSLSMMISGWFVVFSLAGLGEGVTRYISFYRGKNDKLSVYRIFRFSFMAVVALSILLGGILFLTSNFIALNFFHNSQLSQFLKIFSLAVPLFAVSQLLLGSMKAFEKVSEYSFLINIINPATRFISLAVLIFLGLEIFSIPVSVVLAYGVLLIGSIFVCRAQITGFFNENRRINSGLRNELLSYSLPLMFTAFTASLFGWADIFLIGFLKSTKYVGLYDSALPIAMILTLPSFLFIQLFFPMINRSYSRGQSETIRELSKQVGKWIFLLNLPILFFAIFFPESILNVLFGPEFLPAKYSLIFLAIGFFFYAQSEVSLSLLGMIKKSKIRLFNVLITLFMDVILNLALIPQSTIFGIDNSGGIVGAALATMIAYLFYSLLTFTQTYHFTRILPLRRKMFGALISALVAGTAMIYVKSLMPVNKFTIIIHLILFSLIYLTTILITRSLDKNDFLILKTIRKRLPLVNSTNN